jgi:O-antigen/teichoic acid export membrane protein
MFFLLCLAVFGIVLSISGSRLWSMLSPSTPVEPYLRFSFAIASVGFLAAQGTLWLRMEERAAAFAAIQIGSATILTIVVIINLLLLHMGLPGLLFALLISSGCAALVLPWLFGREFSPVIHWDHIRVSMRYAVPTVIGYIAYFILNRINTVILQRQVTVDQIAIFGLAQQLSMIVTIAGRSFGMAMQPAIFAAELDHATDLLARSGKILMLLIFSITCVLLLFGAEIFSMVAPKSYGAGYEIMLVLVVGSFANSFTQISNTTLLYHHRPKISAAVSIAGAVFAVLLGSCLIPSHRLQGAAFASIGAIFAMVFLSHSMARWISGHSYGFPIFRPLIVVCALALFVAWLSRQGFSAPITVSLKIVVGMSVFATIYVLYSRKLLKKYAIFDSDSNK